MEVWFRSFSFLNRWFVGSCRSSSRCIYKNSSRKRTAEAPQSNDGTGRQSSGRANFQRGVMSLTTPQMLWHALFSGDLDYEHILRILWWFFSKTKLFCEVPKEFPLYESVFACFFLKAQSFQCFFTRWLPPLKPHSWCLSRSLFPYLMMNSVYFVPSRGLTYPTLGKGKSSSKCHFWWIC